MAKISARGATKVENLVSLITYPNEHPDGAPTFTVKYTHTLTSDGRILRKVDADGHKVVAKIPKSYPDPVATFRAYVKRFEAARS